MFIVKNKYKNEDFYLIQDNNSKHDAYISHDILNKNKGGLFLEHKSFAHWKIGKIAMSKTHKNRKKNLDLLNLVFTHKSFQQLKHIKS